MQLKNFGLLGFIAGLILLGLSGVLGYALYPSETSPSSRSIMAQPSTNIRIQTPTAERQEIDRPQPAQPDVTPLRYVRWFADEAANSQLKACFVFTENIATEREAELQPFIDISPETPLALSVNGTSLCLGGLAFDQDYAVTLKSGLPSADPDISLGASQTVTVSFGDKPAFVGFSDNGIILPKTKTGGLSIETVNVSELDIIVERVNHRILSKTNPNAGDQSLEGGYSYNYEAWQDKTEVWRGKLDIADRRNETVRTIFPLQNVTEDLGFGAYIVTARRASNQDNTARLAQAWRWIISTDMAITSYRGAEATHVNVRSLKTAALLKDVRLDLIAQNNDLLGQANTGSDGRAVFPAALFDGQGNDAPKMILAYGPDDDFAMLDLERSPLDMTAYDVEGRNSQGLFDIFAYTERGVYRPGETVFLTALIRGHDAQARFDRPVIVTVEKPDGGVAFKTRFTESEMAGGLTLDYELTTGAPRGLWAFIIEPEGSETRKTVRFDVQDFVPQKIKVTSELSEEILYAGSNPQLTIQADFLYGAPGATLEAEAEGRIQIENQPFKAYKDYQFGDAQDTFGERLVEIGYGLTDQSGQLTLPVDLSGHNLTTASPLRVMITSGVAEPSGRFVRKTHYIPLRTQESYIGFKPRFEGRYASHKEAVDIDLTHVTGKGEAIEGALEWRLFEEIHDFQWYRENGRWRYRKDVSDVALFNDTLTLSGDAVMWSRKLPRGQYRLEAIAPNGAKGTMRFNVGWARPGSGVDAPDRIVMGKVEEMVQTGDTVTLSVNSPYAGQGDLVIANEAIKSVQSVMLPEGESELTFTFNKAWGDSVYAMLTLYTPENATGQSIQRRAAGLTYIALDRSDQTLSLDIDVAEKIEPRQTYDVALRIENIPSGETAWVSLAAVDEGILQLTQYDTPDAPSHYFGKKAFSLDVRDDYARLLNPNLGLAAILPQGGDSLGGAGLSVVPERTVSLYQAPVKVVRGQATISLDIPEFQGQLRLMATAWSDSAVGSAEQNLIVRDPVPLTVGLPRFLAPGDKAVATVSLDNLDGPIGEYALQANSALLAESFTERFNLERDVRRDLTLPLGADTLGVFDFGLNISGVQAYQRQDSRQIEVRSPYRPRVTKRLTQLAPGESYQLSQTRLDGFIPEASDVRLTASNLPGLEAQTYLKSLSTYPYGCTEQTVSKAMPMLYAENFGGIEGLSETQRRARIDLAIKRLIARQDSNGAFGLWRVGDGNSSPWLQVYVTEFLLQAKAQGQTVPNEALSLALSAVKKISQPNQYSNLDLDFSYGWQDTGNRTRERRGLERAAYAHHVLAIAGETDVSDLRYLADNQVKNLKDPVALTYLASALSQIGDNRRAGLVIDKAMSTTSRANPYDYYASDLRNAATVVATGHKLLSPEQLSPLVQFIAAAANEDNYLNTQEKSFLLKMIAALDGGEGELSLSAKGLNLSTSKKTQTVSLIGSDLNGDQSLTNTGEAAIWISETISGLPSRDPGALAQGYDLEKTMMSMTGDVLTTQSLVKGERAIIRVSVTPDRKRASMIVLADLLPAGFEIEDILTPEMTEEGMAYDFVGEVSDLDLAEARDDRLVVSDRMSQWDEGPLTTAYIVRAVTEGDFVFPGAVAEDMYRPEIRGRTETTRLKITGAGTN